MTNWKTTVNGILTAILSAAGPLTAYLATINSPKATMVSGIITLVAAIARVWIGLLQNDAQTVPQIAQTIVASGGLTQTASLLPKG